MNTNLITAESPDIQLLELPLLEVEIAKTDFKITVRVAGESSEKAKELVLEILDKVKEWRK